MCYVSKWGHGGLVQLVVKVETKSPSPHKNTSSRCVPLYSIRVCLGAVESLTGDVDDSVQIEKRDGNDESISPAFNSSVLGQVCSRNNGGDSQGRRAYVRGTIKLPLSPGLDCLGNTPPFHASHTLCTAFC